MDHRHVHTIECAVRLPQDPHWRLCLWEVLILKNACLICHRLYEASWNGHISKMFLIL